MASRQEVQRRRQMLQDSIKRSALNGALPPGALLPTVRELGEEHGLSTNVVFQVIQQLTDEGLLYTVPRVGTFVGRGQAGPVAPYLMLVEHHDTQPYDFWFMARNGFEERVAQLGGHSLVLTYDEARWHGEQGDLPALSGVFLTGHGADRRLEFVEGVPRARFGMLEEAVVPGDSVNFDDVTGGMQSTRHLLQAGHRRIAFVGQHAPGDCGMFLWSEKRAQGWRAAMAQAGADTAGLEFTAERPCHSREAEIHKVAAREAAGKLVRNGEFTAVVTSNEGTLSAVTQLLRESDWPEERWPAIVSFDETRDREGTVVSYMRLPWEDIGREAAQVLWERNTGRLEGPGQQRLVPMRLIARLSCQSSAPYVSWLREPQPAAEKVAI